MNILLMSYAATPWDSDCSWMYIWPMSYCIKGGIIKQEQIFPWIQSMVYPELTYISLLSYTAYPEFLDEIDASFYCWTIQLTQGFLIKFMYISLLTYTTHPGFNFYGELYRLHQVLFFLQSYTAYLGFNFFLPSYTAYPDFNFLAELYSLPWV